VVFVNDDWDIHSFAVFKDGEHYDDYIAAFEGDEPEPYKEDGETYYDVNMEIDIKLPFSDQMHTCYSGGGMCTENEFKLYKEQVERHTEREDFMRDKELLAFLNDVETYMQLSDDANRYEYSDDEYLEDMKMAEYEEIKGNKGAIERTAMHYAKLDEAAAEAAHNLSVFEEHISSSLEDVLYAASNLTMRDLQLFRASKEHFEMSDSIQETVQEIKNIAEMEEQEEIWR
jgi:hypothetical protein